LGKKSNMEIFTLNKRNQRVMTTLLLLTVLLVSMFTCLSSVSTVSAQAGWFTFARPPRDQLLRLAGYPASPTSFNPLQYDSGGQGFDVGIMYEPLFGQNTATTDPNAQLIAWLGKSITWTNSTTIDIVLRSDIYWVNLTTAGPVQGRPITTKDVNYTFWLYGGFNSSPTWCYYMNGLRDRLENNGTDQDLASFVIKSDTEFVVRLNPIFANSDVAYRAIVKNRPIVPYDVWSQIAADSADGYAENLLWFANDWTGTVQAMPQAWMIASGMYLPWYHNTYTSDTIMKRNDLWWGQNDPDFARRPYPLYIENYVFSENDIVATEMESGDIDWDSNYIVHLQDVMLQYPNVHTYFWDLPYFPDGSALLMVPNHREYPNGEPWLAKAIADVINYTAISAVYNSYLKTPSPLLLPVDDAIARTLVNTTIEDEYRPQYNVTEALALMNQYCFKGDGTRGTVNGQWYTKDGPTAAEYALYPEYSVGDSAVVDALPQVDGVNVPIPTVGVGSSQWSFVDILEWTDVNAADQVVCDSVQTNLGINLQFTPLSVACMSYVDVMNYVMGNSSFDFAGYCMEIGMNSNLFERYTQFFTGYEGCWSHYGSYRNPALTALIQSLDSLPAGSQAQQNIANQIQTIVGSQLPLIPMGGHPQWYIYSDKYWIGFPDQYSNPLMPATPYINSATIAAVQLGIWRLHPKNADLNGDGNVNILDLSIVARSFGTRPGDPRWITIADVNDDRVVNIVDIAYAARAFGQKFTYT
jgi:peptide/nickel transport system substrate-binding protein